MKPFHFKQFTLEQNKNVFRVGTDGVLLGALSSVKDAGKILEVGTGSGLISLMVAQRNPTAKITALDLDPEAFSLAKTNFSNSSFTKNLFALHQDFTYFSSFEKFDVIISNPPYFDENTSEKDILARQQVTLSFETLIKKSAMLLQENGLLSVIVPFEMGSLFEEFGLKYGLTVHKKIQIFGIENSPPKRWILELGFGEKELEEKALTIEKSPRKFTDDYLNLTQDFHLFKR